MTRLSIKLVAGLVLAAGMVLAGPTDVAAQDEAPIVTYRKGLMQAIRYNNGQIRAVGDAGQPAHAVHYARALYGLGEMLPDVWPQGSTGEGSRAAAAIWSNQRQFNQAVEAFQSATAQLLEAAEGRDQAAFGRAMQALGPTCAGCHQTFRGPAN